MPKFLSSNYFSLWINLSWGISFSNIKSSSIVVRIFALYCKK